jgi:spore coat protein U-like protein
MNKTMKKLFVTAAIALIFSISMAGSEAMAGGSNTLTVTANVIQICSFQTATSSLDFGQIDPKGAGIKTATGTAAYYCSDKDVTETIKSDNGANPNGTQKQMKRIGIGDEYIPYSLTLTKAVRMSNQGQLTFDGSILQADYADKSAGNYSDTVTIEIQP